MKYQQYGSVVMFGGGIDSAAVIEIMRKRVPNPDTYPMHLLYIDYGAKAKTGEVGAMKYYAGKYNLTWQLVPLADVFPSNPITDSDLTDDHQNDYLPGRNMLIASIAFAVAERRNASTILFGGQPLPPNDPMLSWAVDMQPQFVTAFNAFTDLCYSPAKKGAPIARMYDPLHEYASKEQYVRETLKYEPNLFKVTFSCYQSRTLDPCGECAHCIAREALRIQVGG